ncbi:MAG TPA: response regulator [Flavisolibacter sp.]|nr:response regulator [Flavisolibacter sp.]
MEPSKFKNVWLCDDDGDDHYVFAEALQQVQPEANLTLFENGSEVLQQLQHGAPDILFLDINMPMINGLETLQHIREQSALRDLPVIIFSVSEQKTDIAQSYRFGAILYLVKPQLYQDLVTQLKAIFELDWSLSNLLVPLNFDGVRFLPSANADEIL